ncbi:cyclin-I2 [Oryctolagus cuniculus]|uniref:cyclin-I2 n=1 Tax=Oryctolagus cuniculus TaxID=9986 RepID=UPI00387906F9
MASEERQRSPSWVRAGGSLDRRLDQAARCFLLPPRPRAASSPSKCGRFPGSRPPEAASLSKPPPLAKTLRRPAAQVPQPLQQLSPSVPRPVPCDSRSQDQRRLFVRLQLAQGREERQWRGCQLQPEICAAFSGVVQGLLRLPNIFHFSQATFNLALTIFSHLLASVKVNKKLLHIIMVTSLRLAVKVNEEEEVCGPGCPHWAAGCSGDPRFLRGNVPCPLKTELIK